jgi:ABC-type branched-subunit amino acid transport system ATPase component
MTLLKVNDVVSGYGKTDILHGVSITCEKDEIVTIIGPNGAGKSTLFKTIMGYLIPRHYLVFGGRCNQIGTE